MLGLPAGAPAQTASAQTASAAAAPSGYRDTRADDGRTVPAYLPSTDPDRVVRVFSVTFWARQGERRSVTADVIARQPATTPDSALMAAVSVSCSPTGGGVASAGATQNLVRGSGARFTPRFVYDVPRTGMVGCVLVATGLRPRPVASGYASANRWYVDAGSSLSVSQPLGWWARSLETDARSRVLGRGQSWSPIQVVTRVDPAGTAFTVTSDHKVTTCSSVGGSRDASTAGRELCADRVETTGSRVRSVVTAVQLDRRGDPCARPQEFSTLRRVTPTIHHAMVFSQGVVRVSRSAACRPVFRISGRLEQVGGADLVIHAPSERTTILSH